MLFLDYDSLDQTTDIEVNPAQADVGSHLITLFMTLLDYPSMPPISVSFTVTVEASNCINGIVDNPVTLVDMTVTVSESAT